MWLIAVDRRSRIASSVNLSKFDIIQCSHTNGVDGSKKVTLMFRKISPEASNEGVVTHVIDVTTVDDLKKKFGKLFEHLEEYGYDSRSSNGVISTFNSAYYGEDNVDKLFEEFVKLLNETVLDGAENMIIGKILYKINHYHDKDPAPYVYLCSVLFDVNIDFLNDYFHKNYPRRNF